MRGSTTICSSVTVKTKHLIQGSLYQAWGLELHIGVVHGVDLELSRLYCKSAYLRYTDREEDNHNNRYDSITAVSVESPFGQFNCKEQFLVAFS